MKIYIVYQYIEYEGNWDHEYFFSADKANKRHKDLQLLKPWQIWRITTVQTKDEL